MIIQSRRVWIAGLFMPAQIEIQGKKIRDILPYGTKREDNDYGNDRIIPGLIDIHTHGYQSWDTNDATEEGLRRWMKEIPAEGVTALCPTTITQSREVLSSAVKNVAHVVKQGYEGAEILGIHFEGPYLDKVFKGAQPEPYCVKPDVESFRKYQEDACGLILVIGIVGAMFGIWNGSYTPLFPVPWTIG